MSNMPTTTATASTSSSSSPPSSSHSEQLFTEGGLSPPLIVGFISLGAFTLGLVCLCAWRKFTGRQVWHNNGFVPRRYYLSASLRRQQRQRLQPDGSVRECKSAERPVMFEAWTLRRTADVLKWAGSVVSLPLSLSSCSFSFFFGFFFGG